MELIGINIFVNTYGWLVIKQFLWVKTYYNTYFFCTDEVYSKHSFEYSLKTIHWMIIGSSCSVLTFSGERYDTQGILTKNSDHTVSPWVVYVHLNIGGADIFTLLLIM